MSSVNAQELARIKISGRRRVLGQPHLGQLLVQEGLITSDQLAAALDFHKSNNCRLGAALVALGSCSEEDIARATAKQLDIPFIDLHLAPPSPEVVALLPASVAVEHGVLPVRMDGPRLIVAALDPCNIRADEAIRTATGLSTVLAVAPETQLTELIDQYFRQPMESEPEPMPQENSADLDLSEAEDVTVEDLVSVQGVVSTPQIVSAIIVDAARRGASDIHIEPGRRYLRVRFRIDGRMYPVVTLSSSLAPSIAARIKVTCGMDIADSRRPQDGGCRMQIQGRAIELRASTLPGMFGEIAVLRLQDAVSELTAIDSLGFEPAMARGIHGLLAARQGMLLITGPTGSGKTTTLYAGLSQLNRDDVNIITVEDPVERTLEGINQVQVNDRAGRSFANTLRSMLRQDPDVIMVGEIRDAETADIAARASLTGHLVLSTLHTLDSLSTLTRLRDMGVAPYMIAAALNGVLAQRLARRVCENCAAEYDPPSRLKRAFERRFGSTEGCTFRRGRGCPSCHYKGVRGRVGIYELLEVDDEMRTLLSENASLRMLREHLHQKGYSSLEEDAFRKASQGLVPPQEVIELGLGFARVVDAEPRVAISKRPTSVGRPVDPMAAAGLSAPALSMLNNPGPAGSVSQVVV